MTAGTLFLELSRRRVILKVDGDRLMVDAPQGALTPELQTALVEHRDVVYTALKLAGPGRPVRLDHLMEARGLA